MSRAVEAAAARTPGARAVVQSFAPALVAAGTLGLGYVDLARGGATISALLLVVGYVALVPWAIMRAGIATNATWSRHSA